MGHAAEGSADSRRILAGTSQNVVGVVVAAAATLIAQVLIGRTLGAGGFGIVTVATQAAFVASFATRAGMDMAVLRSVAVSAGLGDTGTEKATVRRAAVVAAVVSGLAALGAVAGAAGIRAIFSLEEETSRGAIEAAAAALPFLALTNVWLSATRGLKIMRYTLYVFWAGQPLAWIVLMIAGWRISETPWMTAAAYSLSWALAAAAAWWCWRRESRGWADQAPAPDALRSLAGYAAPRAPAALFSQLLFWTDLFVLTRYVADADVGVYSAALRAGQVVVLFLTSVNLMFSPYVADLYNRGRIEHLARLFKQLTRWTLAATLPGFLLLAAAPGAVLSIFGGAFDQGRSALLILLAGQLVNLATGSVGFILIMVGRTGWDLVVYAGSLVWDVALAFYLCPRYGIEGAAVANALTFGVSNLVRLWLVWRLVGIQPYDRHYLRLLPAAGVAGAVMLLVGRAVSGEGLGELAVTAAAGFAAYAAVMLASGLTAEERTGARRLLSHLRRA